MAEAVKSAGHANFYENLAEVKIRIVGTTVLYDGVPHYVLCAGDHMKDGIMRVYLDDLTNPKGPAHLNIPGIPFHSYGNEGQQMDEWLKTNEKKGIVRKMMNSPAFNKFRPFPLGMCNYEGQVTYIERIPQRHTHQGLTPQAMHHHSVSLEVDRPGARRPTPQVGVGNIEFADMIMGKYPTLDSVIENLLDQRCSNVGAAFHREFAIIRGPMDSLYLAYKSDVVGILSYADRTHVKLGKNFRHCKEVIERLRLFETVE